MADRRCGRCGEPYGPSQQFCGSCGASLPRVCDSCGASSPAEFRFCGSCGSALGGPPAAELTEQRRRATIVFADLSGFTALSERADPEDVRTEVGRVLDELERIVDRFGGTVTQVMGDGIMAIFGAPVSHEDDPERAVRAALEMQRFVAEDGASSLPLRVGVNTGEVLFGPHGPTRAVTALGDATNVASRLQGAAPVAGVLVGEETYEATRTAVRYQPVEPLTLKGKRDPVAAWLALEATDVPLPRRVSAVPMVGRGGELDLLRTIWARVSVERQPHLVTVLGPPGIGKTRLSREFVRSVESSGVRTVHGRSLPYGERTGYAAFAQQIRQVAGVLDSDPVPLATQKVVRAVDALVPHDPGEVAERIAAMIGLDGSPSTEKGVLFAAARALVEGIAAQAPTVFVFEDIHWADHTMCELIEFLAARVTDAPVLLLTLARPELLEQRPAWGGGLRAYTVVPLRPLADEDAGALADMLVAESPDRDDATPRLVEIAGGNPLFLEELAAGLAEGASFHDLPDAIAAIIASRIDGLPPATREVVLDAAVVGQIFWRGAVGGGRADADLDEALAGLEARDLVRRQPVSRIASDEEYAFKHALIRDVAYATLPRAVRRERHRRVAVYLEAATGDRSPEWGSLLAHHWHEAGEDERAIGYHLAAAAAASGVWAKAEAVAQYDAALELIIDTAQRRDVSLLRALAMVDAADYASARPALLELLPLLDGQPLLDAIFALGRAAFWLMDSELLLELAGRALEASDTVGSPELRAPALAMVDRAKSLDGDVLEAIEVGEQSLRDWPEDVYGADLVFHLGQLGTEYVWIGRFGRAIELTRRGYALGVESQMMEAIFAGSALTMALAGAGRTEEALDVGEEVIALGREMEVTSPRFTARALSIVAGALRDAGDLASARVRNEEAIEVGDRSGFRHPALQARVDLLLAELEAGNIGEAERRWPDLWKDAHHELGLFFSWLIKGRLAHARAEIRLEAGDIDGAIESATDSIDRAQRTGRAKYEALGRAVLATAMSRSGRTTDAVAEARRGVTLARAIGHPPTLFKAASALTVVAAAGADDDAAAEADRLARATIDAYAARLKPERRATLLASPAVVRMLG